MISESKEVKEWDLDLNIEPDRIEANILKRPEIYQPVPNYNNDKNLQG